MNIQPVQSRHVAGIGYDPLTQELQVAFHTGLNYVYKGVPQETYDEMVQSESVGQYHALSIRNKFEYQKVVEEQ